MSETRKTPYERIVLGDKQKQEALERNRKAHTLKMDVGKEERIEYLQKDEEYKKKLLKKEAMNYTRVYVMKNWDGWLKVYDHSAVIVGKWLDGKLGRSYHVNEDRGYGEVAAYGAVSIPPVQVGDFVRAMLNASLKLVNETDDELEFELGERVPQEDMVRMLHESELIDAKANEIVLPKEKLPNLKASTAVLIDLLYSLIREQKSGVKEVFLDDVEQRAVKMNKMVILTARGTIKLGKCLKDVLAAADELHADAKTMRELKLITARQYLELVNRIHDVEMEVKREIKRRKIASERTLDTDEINKKLEEVTLDER